MDPNKTLARIRELAAVLMDSGSDVIDDNTYELCECIRALDRWISKGGFLPSTWKTP